MKRLLRRRIALHFALLLLTISSAKGQEEGPVIEVMDHLGGFVNTAAVEDGLALVGQAQTISAYNVADAEFEAAGFLIMDFEAQELAIGDGFAAARYQNQNFVDLIDISDPDNLSLIRRFESGPDNHMVMGIAAQGSLLLLADHLIEDFDQKGEGRLRVFDLSDPNAPSELGSLAIQGAQRMAIDGSRIFLTSGTNFSRRELQVIDVADPANPSILGSLTMGQVDGIAAAGDFVYTTGSDTRLTIVDASNPANPFQRSQTALGDNGFLGLAVDGDVAYLGAFGGFFELVDVSNPDAPQQTASIKANDFGITSIRLFSSSLGTTALIADQFAKLIDVSDPAAPAVQSELLEPWEPLGMASDGENMYLGDGDRVYHFALQEGATEFRKVFDCANCLLLAVNGPRVYAATRDNEVLVLESNGDTPPQERGRYAAGDRIANMKVDGDRLYLLTGRNFNQDGKLEIVDVADAANPSRLARVDLPGRAFDVHFGDALPKVIFVSFDNVIEGTKGVLSIDVSTASDPDIIATIPAAESPLAIWLSGKTLLVGGSEENQRRWSIEVFDVSDPADPLLVASTGDDDSRLADITYVHPTIVATFPEFGMRRFELRKISGAKRDDKGGPDRVLESEITEVAKEEIPCPLDMIPGSTSATIFPIPTGDDDEPIVPTTATIAPFLYLNGGFSHEGEKSPSKGLFCTCLDTIPGKFDPNRPPELTLETSFPPGGRKCIPDSTDELIMANARLITNIADSWDVKSISFQSIGRLKEKLDGKTVFFPILKVRGRSVAGTVNSNAQGIVQTISFSINEKIAPASVLPMQLVYTFKFPSKVFDGRFMPCPIGDFFQFKVSSQVTLVSADPENKPPGVKNPPQVFTSPEHIITCVFNVLDQTPHIAIQEAVDKVEGKGVGELILVCPGVWTERVRVDKTVAIVSENTDPKLHEVRVAGGTPFTIAQVGVTIQGFSFFGGLQNKAIELAQPLGLLPARMTVSNNTFRDFAVAVDLAGFDLNIEENEFNNNGTAIRINPGGQKVKIKNNGIFVPKGAGGGRFNKGMELRKLIDSEVTDNKVQGSDRDLNVGIEAVNTKTSRFTNNIVSEGRVGIQLTGSRNNLLFENAVSGHKIGIFLENNSNDNRVSFNTVTGVANDGTAPTGAGAVIHNSSDVLLEFNNLFFTTFGVDVFKSDKVKVQFNQIIKANFVGVNGVLSNVVTQGNDYLNNGRDESIKATRRQRDVVFAVDGNGFGGLFLEGCTGIAYGNRFDNDSLDNIRCSDGTELVVRHNIFERPARFGLTNDDESILIDARGNWWGDASGPGGEGPGSGTAVGLNVDFSDFLDEAISLVAAAETDTAFVAAGTSASISFYFQNWERIGDNVNLSISDEQGWITGATNTSATLDSLGAGHAVEFIVPNDGSETQGNALRVQARSAGDAEQFDEAQVHLVGYTPALSSLFVLPDTVPLLPGELFPFDVIALDQHTKEIDPGIVNWTAQGGAIDDEGVFTAGAELGVFPVTAQLEGGLEARGFVEIVDAVVSVSEAFREEGLRGSVHSFAYPNPFSNETNIRFSLKQRGHVLISISDALGRVVATLTDQTLAAGSYAVRWKAAGFNSGSYFYRISTDDYTESRQILLAR